MEKGLVPAAVAGSAVPKLERFGRYWLIDRIATGGMAEVYRAVTHGVEGFRRTFIIKRILAHKASSPAWRRMFCDEARISALLHHPNIAQVYDFGHVAGSYFLAMEYLPGKDLASVTRVLRAEKAAMPPGLAAYVAREAALGLHYAHTLQGPHGAFGIVHRDVTPSNIMLLFEGGVKLLDFGIAKSTQAAAEDPNVVKGKFAYLAPEQARGQDVDGRADVFALGVTLWEMLVGQRLFLGKDDVETLRNVLGKPVPPPSSLRPQIPVVLDRIVLRALERERDQRYATAEELASECEAVLGTLRADGMTLRAFLKDLFNTESTSVAHGVPELPERLFEERASSSSAIRHRAGATRPSSGAIPSVEVSFTTPRRNRVIRLTSLGGVVLTAGTLIVLRLALHGSPRPARAITHPVAAPIVAAPPIVEFPQPVAPSDAKSLTNREAAPAEIEVASPRETHRRHTHHRATHLRKLPADLTMDPF